MANDTSYYMPQVTQADWAHACMDRCRLYGPKEKRYAIFSVDAGEAEEAGHWERCYSALVPPVIPDHLRSEIEAMYRDREVSAAGAHFGVTGESIGLPSRTLRGSRIGQSSMRSCTRVSVWLTPVQD